MSHSHHHSHSDSHSDSQKNISVAFFLNAFFVVVEVVGGLLTNSIAILTDALHDFGDCLSLATAWFLQKKSSQGRDNHYTYGYRRFSLLGSIFLSGVLSISSVVVVIEAVKRIIEPQAIMPSGMLWIALFGIAINGAAALKVKSGTSFNERAVYLHILEDVMGWVAVLVASVVMIFVEFPILDSILSIVISIWVLYNVFKNMRAVFKILLQSVPDGISLDDVNHTLMQINGVESVHDLHIWSLDGESHVMTLHVVTDENDHTTLKSSILSAMKTFNIAHITIEFEPLGSVCTTNCDVITSEIE